MPEKNSPHTPAMPLHEFLRRNQEAILKEWERVARRELASARELSRVEHRNNIPNMIAAIADQHEQSQKTPGTRVKLPKQVPRSHAEQRWRLAMSLEDVTREYGLLRKVILQMRLQELGELHDGEAVFLNEALDEAIIEGVMTYVASSNKDLEDERERLQVTLMSIADGVVSTDPEGYIRYLNPAAEDIIGWPAKEAVGRPVNEVIVAVEESTRERLSCLTQTAAEAGRVVDHPSDILLQRQDGGLVPAEETAAPLRGANGDFLGVVTTFRDVSKIRDLTSQLGYLAVHDTLTGLPNRALLSDRLTQELAHAERNDNRLALLYLDLDLFKDVNDMLGHVAGDELLKQVAKRLQDCVRRTDTVCRVGGDEFVILLTEFGALEYLTELGENITNHLKQPYDIGPDRVHMSISVGVSVFPDDGQDPETMIKHADVAMYRAKELGRNNVQFFAPEMNRQVGERRKLQSELRKALKAGQLSLRFQPQIDLETGLLVGAEALLRWRHPKLGLVSPSRFIPVAEDSRDIMVAIGQWVLEQACGQARTWLDAGYPPMRLSVNVSLLQLRNEYFVEQVAEILHRFSLPPDVLQLELTESVLMSDIVGATARIRALEQMGVRIAVDDFGTGYSSLSYLKDLPVDELKIDQSFVHDIGLDENKAAIVQAVIRMGQSLKLRVIAEGVEDLSTVEFLTANGCEGAQGYYYSKAIVAKEFERRYLRH